MKKVYEYEVKIDFIKKEKTKTIYEHKQLAETEKQIAYLNASWVSGQHISVLNKKKEKYQSDNALSSYETARFHLSDWKDEYSAYVFLDKKPKSEKVVFNKLQKLLMQRLHKDHSRYLMEAVISFDGIKVVIKTTNTEAE